MAGQDDLDAELSTIRDIFGASDIITLRRDFVCVVLQRTRYNRLKVKLTPPEGYPEERVLLSLESDVLPPPLLRKLTRAREEGISAAVGQPQMVRVLEELDAFLQENRFTTCWKEVRQATQLVTEHGGQVGLDEATGTMTVRIGAIQRGSEAEKKCAKKSGRHSYWLTLRIEIPEAYPEEGTSFTVGRHSFPEKMLAMYVAQARDAVRKCVAGDTVEVALRASNPVRGPSKKHSGGDGTPTVKLTNEHMRSLKNDVRFLKKVTDLRAVNTTRENRNGTLVNGTDERRRARRLLTRIQKKEHEADEEYEKRMQELELAEDRAEETADGAQPSLGAVIHLMVKKLVIDIPQEECQACEQKILPEDPEARVLHDDEAPMRPLRVFCGHYFHWQCLNAWMSTPPFVRSCRLCQRRIYHPDWPADHRIMERAWANKQAREREINDVSDFLGVDDAFAVK